jgi:hypothetical protein
MNEQQLFDWLKTNHFPDLNKSESEFDGFDCQSDEKKLFIELKSRKTHYDELIIEKYKYDFLVTEAGKLSYAPCYINYTPQGVYFFDLEKLLKTEYDFKWQDKWLPITTEFANNNNRIKKVGMLHTDWAVKLV